MARPLIPRAARPLIPRAAQALVAQALRRSPVVAVVGPRQCGKTTLARQLVPPDSPNYFDLEDPVSLARLDQRSTALRGLAGVVVIDEVQHRPDLFPVLRVLADRDDAPARFLVLGSAGPRTGRPSTNASPRRCARKTASRRRGWRWPSSPTRSPSRPCSPASTTCGRSTRCAWAARCRSRRCCASGNGFWRSTTGRSSTSRAKC